jgi:hypothetical protein
MNSLTPLGPAKTKITKNLKLILNQIYKLNFKGGSNIRNVKFFGVQVYSKHFYVYSLQCINPKLYLFKQEMRFGYLTSPTYFRSQLGPFIKNMLTLKSLVDKSSVENVLVAFINDELFGENEGDEKYIESLENSLQKKKNK